MVDLGWRELSLPDLIQETLKLAQVKTGIDHNELSESLPAASDKDEKGRKLRPPWKHKRAKRSDEIELNSCIDSANGDQCSTFQNISNSAKQGPKVNSSLGVFDLEARSYSTASQRNIPKFWKTVKEKIRVILGLWYNEYILHQLLRRARISHIKNQRKIDLNTVRVQPLTDDRTGRLYISNKIRSSRYTLWNFVPFQIAFQFRKASNVYFLVTAILGMFSGFSTTGKFTNLVPLLVFWSLTVAREGYDDFKRYRLDKVENKKQAQRLCVFCEDGCIPGQGRHAETLTLKGQLMKIMNSLMTRRSIEGIPMPPTQKSKEPSKGSLSVEDETSKHRMWAPIKWADLKVGDIIKLQRGDEVPADIVLLYANGRNGVAYVETMALDGETNFKSRSPLSQLAKQCKNLSGIQKCHAHFEIEDPNPDLYTFDGMVTVDHQTLPLTLKNVIYRGSTLRNTQMAIGLVINTGEECKIRMNSNQELQAKAPAMQHTANYLIISMAIFVFALTVVFSCLYIWWTHRHEERMWYLKGAHFDNAETIIGFAIEFNNLVPLALFITMEVMRYLQLGLLHDIEMYDPVSNTPMVCNTQSLFENLGQIGYIFSDKTGTLTENVMVFKKMSVAGRAWVHSLPFGVQESRQLEYSRDVVKESDATSEKDTVELMQYLKAHDDSITQKTRLLLLAMAICHTCFPETQNNGQIDYQAESPDELALVDAARDMGYKLIERTDKSVTILSEIGKPVRHTYEILNVIEFSPSRKSMSVIVRLEDQRICILCKGADSVMKLKMKHYEALKSDSDQRLKYKHPNSTNTFFTASGPQALTQAGSHQENEIFESCLSDIERFATEGLRTLVYGHRFITEEEYSSWKRKFQTATTSLQDRQKIIEAAAEIIEKDFELTGVTAIEDRLQRGVPETIKKLRRANIKTWMLTGDKRETAINISHSAQICRPDSEVIILHHKSPNSTNSIEDQIVEAQLKTNSSRRHCMIVVDGQILTEIESIPHVESALYDLLLQVDSVICCRASPSQKAAMVKSVRDRVRMPLTLAIGDGGNDIAMIKEAHVGIGISGKEGLQASRVADYSIAQFRFLQRLLLVHGHWNYIRTAKFVILTFWKEMMFYSIRKVAPLLESICFLLTKTEILYQFWDGYTGTTLYETTFLTVWNTLFSSLCVLIPGVLEQDLSATTLLAVPEVYRYGQDNRAFNLPKCFAWMAGAICEGCWIWFMAHSSYGLIPTMEDQRVYAIGTLAATACVIFINFKLLILNYYYRTWIPIVAFTVTVSGWFAWDLVFSFAWKGYLGPEDLSEGLLEHFGKELTWWAVLFLLLAGLLVGEIMVDMLQREYWPSITDIWQELEQDKNIRRMLEAAAKEKDTALIDNN